ncbi:MAG TPA: phosphoribosyltransferase family protein, partial [Patescibacteria group bacterium]|nr:phosphoribosyltransferase family protein [Patescibacteria group bacterium]
AVTEEGDAVWNERERRIADKAYLGATIESERAEARRRLETYRAGMPPRVIRGKTALIVDDGVATGNTMRAAIATVKRGGAVRVVVAVPVCPPDSLAVLKAEVDEVVALEIPDMFGSIGAYYDTFPQTDDATVIRLLRRP